MPEIRSVVRRRLIFSFADQVWNVSAPTDATDLRLLSSRNFWNSATVDFVRDSNRKYPNVPTYVSESMQCWKRRIGRPAANGEHEATS